MMEGVCALRANLLELSALFIASKKQNRTKTKSIVLQKEAYEWRMLKYHPWEESGWMKKHEWLSIEEGWWIEEAQVSFMRRSSTDEKAHVPTYPWEEGGWMKKHEVPIHEKKVDKWRSPSTHPWEDGRCMKKHKSIIHEKKVDEWRSPSAHPWEEGRWMKIHKYHPWEVGWWMKKVKIRPWEKRGRWTKEPKCHPWEEGGGWMKGLRWRTGKFHRVHNGKGQLC